MSSPTDMPVLQVVMYHYVRDFPRTRFPRIKGLMLDEFREQVQTLAERHEMATIESALAFLRGEYQPSRNLCLLTFDDGLKEHCRQVTEILSDAGIVAVFFIATSCLEQSQVAPVHMNQFLMASLRFEEYTKRFFARLDSGVTDLEKQMSGCGAIAKKTYPWDLPEVAAFKYLFNFDLDPGVRDEAIRQLFEECLGSQEDFARELYLSWEEAQNMQAAHMVIGGHTHSHRPLAAMTPEEMAADLSRCRELLSLRLLPQPCWPFSYPYGKSDSFTRESIAKLKELGFACSFSTEPGNNRPGSDLFCIRRIDCKNALN